MIEVGIKRFDTTLPLPAYQTTGSVGIDLYARVATVIPAKSIALVPLNVALQLPEGTWGLLAARSSLCKKGLLLANGIGVADYDYRGDNNEYQAVLLNVTEQDVTVDKGERIVQLIVTTYDRVAFTEKAHFTAVDRGAFGSTGS